MCKVVGVTGGIAGGKSLFVEYLGEMGAETVSADIIARNLLDIGTESYQRVLDYFGKKILLADGMINRAALGEIVFGSDEARETLNSIVHPEVIRLISEYINNFRSAHKDEAACLIVEVPLLFECNMQGLFDITVVITVEQAIQMRRLIESRGMTREQALERINAQFSDSLRRKLADIVILNNGSADELRAKARIFATDFGLFSP